MRSTMAYLLITNSSLVTNVDKYHVTIERFNPLTRGEMYVFRELTIAMDQTLHKYTPGRHGEKAVIIIDYDREKLMKSFIDCI